MEKAAHGQPFLLEIRGNYFIKTKRCVLLNSPAVSL